MTTYSFYIIQEIVKNINKRQNVYLYPAGQNTKILLDILYYIGKGDYIQIIDKENKEINGKSTISVDTMANDNNSIVYITSPKYEKELVNTLKTSGYLGEIANTFCNQINPNCKEDNIYIERMDLVLTTRCSLRCEKCANLMQYYHNPSDVDEDVIYNSMNNLINVVDSINAVYVLGGEPLLYSKLKNIICYLKKQDKIKKVIVVTNGTLCPDDIDLWEEFSCFKVVLHISDYTILSRNKDNIIKKCFEHAVNCEIEENKIFYDTGNMKKRNRTDDELQNVFIRCNTKCRSLFNGEFHFCPRSSHGVDLGLVERRKEDYVDLMTNRDTLRNELFEFLNRDNYIEACDYCDIRLPGYYEKEYPAAVQAKNVLTV